MIGKKKTSRILITLLWVGLLAGLLSRDYFVPSLEQRELSVLQRSREESFSGVYFQGERIGFVKQRLIPGLDTPFLLEQEAYLLLNILGERHPISLKIRAGLSEQSLLLSFDFHMNSSLYNMHAQGVVDHNLVRFSLSTGKDTITDTVRLNSPPFLATHQRAYLLDQGLQPGERMKVPYFDPVTLAGKDSLLEYKGLEKILIRGRMENLHHFVESFAGIRVNAWLNDEGLVIREESPAGFVFLSEPEFQATAISGPVKEILSSVSIPVSGPLPDMETRKSITYAITLPQGEDLQLSGHRQHWRESNLTVRLEDLPNPAAQACDGPEEYLAATLFVQAGHKDIGNLADSIATAGAADWPTAERLAQWVHDNLKKIPVIGIPDALTTLRTLQGDCNEHATLFTALARSRGIPTRIVAGVTLLEDAFFYHAWNEVCVADRWISLDTTKNQIPADATHIKFVEGESREMIRIGALIGNLEIRILPASEKP